MKLLGALCLRLRYLSNLFEMLKKSDLGREKNLTRNTAHYKITLIALKTRPNVTLKPQKRKHLRGTICAWMAV